MGVAGGTVGQLPGGAVVSSVRPGGGRRPVYPGAAVAIDNTAVLVKSAHVHISERDGRVAQRECGRWTGGAPAPRGGGHGGIDVCIYALYSISHRIRTRNRLWDRHCVQIGIPINPVIVECTCPGQLNVSVFISTVVWVPTRVVPDRPRQPCRCTRPVPRWCTSIGPWVVSGKRRSPRAAVRDGQGGAAWTVNGVCTWAHGNAEGRASGARGPFTVLTGRGACAPTVYGSCHGSTCCQSNLTEIGLPTPGKQHSIVPVSDCTGRMLASGAELHVSDECGVSKYTYNRVVHSFVSVT